LIVAADWVNPLIAGAAGVFGAIVGVTGTIWVNLHRDKQAAARERRDALISLYAAANALGHFWIVWADMRRQTGRGTVGDFRLGMRIAGSRNLLITRLFGLADAFWHANAHAMSVLDEEARRVVSAVEQAVSEWNFDGEEDEMPESWVPAIRGLRELIERRGLPPHE
jgi:hypothetical protein